MAATDVKFPAALGERTVTRRLQGVVIGVFVGAFRAGGLPTQ
jgi:hypothetical protein